MKKRCLNPAERYYFNYGGRGITVCARWLHSFENFYADMGPRPAGASIDRIDSNGNYEPGNCRWATRHEQARNMRSNRRVTIDGETLTVAEWSLRSGIGQATIGVRIRNGWEARAAVYTAPYGRIAKGDEP